MLVFKEPSSTKVMLLKPRSNRLTFHALTGLPSRLERKRRTHGGLLSYAKPRMSSAFVRARLCVSRKIFTSLLAVVITLVEMY